MIDWLSKHCFLTEDEYCISSHKKRIDYSREVITSNIAHWKSCPKYFVYYPIKKKKWSHYFGLFKCSKFGLLNNFQCQYPRLQSLNCHSDHFCQIRLNFNLAGREEGKGAIISWGQLFKIFWTTRDDYLREVPSLNINVVVNFLSRVIFVFL